MTIQYNDPAAGIESNIGNQFETFKWQKKALVEMAKEQYFSPLANVVSMPKHFGKKIKKYHYLPLLDDANLTDQGIDANGVSTTLKVTIVIRRPTAQGSIYTDFYGVGEGATAGAALTAAELDAESVFKNLEVFDTDYATTTAALLILAEPWSITVGAAVPNTGNLYGSSKDVGYITGKMPKLTENGGRVNRVGYKRVEIEGTIEKYGIFDEYTKESMDFDTDAELGAHLTSEMLKGANEITEDLLQVDLLNSAGIVRFGGSAASTSEINGEAGTESLITYLDLMKIAIDLSNNRTPKKTTLISGSRMIDTKTIDGAHILYIGSELTPQVRGMQDQFGNQAFVPVHKYADAGNLLNGEIGSIYQFRVVEVPEMMHWAGEGAAVVANSGYRETGGNYDVYPMLTVGDKAFSTIGFQTDGKTTKFKIKHSKPESDISYSHDDPFGEKGFSSIKFYYGFLLERPERIACAKCVAQW